MDSKTIEEIVDSYKLTDKQREIVLRKARQRMDYYSYPEIYALIGDTVEFLKTPWNQRYQLSLDQKIGDTDIEMHNFFGKKEDYLHEQEEIERLQSLHILAENFFKDIFSKEEYKLLSFLVTNTDLEEEEFTDILTTLTEKDIKEMRLRLRQIKENLYDKDPSSVERGDLHVSNFNPFQIKFRQRKYHGSPLDFYLQNKSLYEGMNRKQLERFDPGLARHLRYRGQIEEAIPETVLTNSLPKEHIKNIINSYEACYGCPRIASKRLGFASTTISRYWKKRGLKIHLSPYRFQENPLRYFREHSIFHDMSRSQLRASFPGLCKALTDFNQLEEAIPETLPNNSLNKEQIESIIELHEQYEGNIRQASLNSNHAPQTIAKYWIEAGLHKKRKFRNYKGNPLAYFRDNYEIYAGLSRGELAKFDQGLYTSLWKMRQLDLAIPEKKSITRLKKETIQKVISAYVPSKGVLTDAVLITGVSTQTISKYWKQGGLEVIGKSLHQEEIDDILDAYTAYEGNIIRAAEGIGRARSTVAKYWKEHGLQINTKKVGTNQGLIESIVNQYDITDGKASVAAENTGVTIQTVTRYWRRAGLKVHTPGTRISENQIENIYDAFELYDGKVTVAAKALGRDHSTVKKYWKKKGLI